MFKKVVVADTCAVFVNDIFGNAQDHSGPTLVFGAICFAFQIYGDFSGYSDIAIGTARLFGIRLMTNFKMPYFSRDIAEFWRRWHISLSTWFRDYLYIPLGGSRVGKWKAVRNTFAIFLVSGFWHGANWTFVVWGLIHALLFLPLLLLGVNRRHISEVASGHWLPSMKEIGQMGVTFILVTIGWVFFRASSLTSAIDYVQGMGLNWPTITTINKMALFWVAVMVCIEWIVRRKDIHGQLYSNTWLNRSIRWLLYSLAVWLIMKNLESQAEFIYFQF